MFLHSRHVVRRDFHEIAYAEHKAIRDVLVLGDPEAAATVIEDHLVGSYHRLIESKPEN